MDEALLEAYRHTRFIAQTEIGPLEIRIGQRCPPLDELLTGQGVSTWAYVTAFNPASNLLSEQDNIERQRQLGRLVSSQGYLSYSGEGIAENSRWPPEASLLILGIQRADAVQLAQKFGQLAIVCGAVGHAAELVLCR